jgi:hypothetical protein
MPYKNKTEQLIAQKQHYADNRKDYKWRQQERREAARNYINDIKKRSSCKNCGNNNYIVLDFHHRDKNLKEITANEMVANKYSPSRIDLELEKCDVLCSNCHRIVHHELGLL